MIIQFPPPKAPQLLSTDSRLSFSAELRAEWLQEAQADWRQVNNDLQVLIETRPLAARGLIGSVAKLLKAMMTGPIGGV